MDVDWVENQLDAIRTAGGDGWIDDEQAHALQDELWLAVLKAIAAGEVDNPQTVAAKACETENIKFSRWYA